MKVAVSAHGSDLDAMINPRFGRCDYFVIVDTETNQVTSWPNENINATGGAGIQSATFVLSKGAQVLITGSVGPKAMGVFENSGIQVITGQSGTVKQAIEQFKEGVLGGNPALTSAETSAATNAPFSSGGMGGGRGMGGGGRGMGGGGRGMGGGGRGMCGGGGRRQQ